jgi:hypothetical protein
MEWLKTSTWSAVWARSLSAKEAGGQLAPDVAELAPRDSCTSARQSIALKSPEPVRFRATFPADLQLNPAKLPLVRARGERDEKPTRRDCIMTLADPHLFKDSDVLNLSSPS